MIENQLKEEYKKVKLGFSSKYTLYDSGCLLCCVARLLQKPVIEVHDKLKLMGCFYADKTGDVCLLDLNKVPRAYPQLTYTGKFTYDNNLALEVIKSNGIVIAEVDYNPIMDGTQQHFVCMVGDRKIEDPLGGKIKLVGNYKTYPTLRIFEVKPVTNSEPDMTDEQKRILDFLAGKTEGDVREAFGYLSDKAKHDEQMATLSQKVLELDKFTKSLQEKIDILTSEVTSSNEIITKWQDEAKIAKEQAGNAVAQIQQANEEKNKYRRLYEGLLDKTVDKVTSIELINQLFVRIKQWIQKKK